MVTSGYQLVTSTGYQPVTSTVLSGYRSVTSTVLVVTSGYQSVTSTGYQSVTSTVPMVIIKIPWELLKYLIRSPILQVDKGVIELKHFPTVFQHPKRKYISPLINILLGRSCSPYIQKAD